MMLQKALLPLTLAVALPSWALPNNVANLNPRASCATGFHIIVARAAGELPGEGSTGTLANDIVAKAPGSDSVGLRYPALPAPAYSQSETTGVQNLQSAISSYTKACPKAGIVLLGYDEGADVVADVLGGSGTSATDPIEGADAKAIKGIILFSDPSYVPGQPYDAGTSTKSGTYPRSKTSLKNLLRFSKIMRSYCDKGDTVCASGSNEEANRQYLTKYQKAAANFVVSLYE